MGDYLIRPGSVFYVDNKLIVSDKIRDTLIHVIDARSQKYIKSMGVSGFGPNEIADTNGSFSAKLATPNYIWAYDTQQRRMSKFNLIENSDNRLAEEQFVFRSADFMSLRVVWTNSNTLLGLAFDGFSKFIEYDTIGNELQRYGDYDNDLSKKYPKSVISHFYQGFLRANRANDLFAQASIYADQIEVLNIEDNLITKIEGPLHLEPAFSVASSGGYPVMAIDIDEAHYGYLDVFVGENYVYGLYSGKKWNGNPWGKGVCDIIYVFNLKGEVKKKFLLSDPIKTFTIDEPNGIIYGVSDGEEYDILQFNMQ